MMEIGDGSGPVTLLVTIRPARVPTDGATLRYVESYRPDGTLVQVSVNPPDGGTRPMPTLDQLVVIARVPALTLFP